MAKRRSNRKAGIIISILGAAMLGLVIGIMLYNDPGTPLPAPAEVEFNKPYDDEWGKLKTPVSHVSVEQILVTWKDANPRVTPKDPERTKEEAYKLIVQLWNRYKNQPDRDNFKRMQTGYNEDSQVHNVYGVPNPQGGSYVKPFTDCAKSTDEGFARIVESEFGYHLIRRLKQGE